MINYKLDKVNDFIQTAIQYYNEAQDIYSYKRILRCILANKDILDDYI